MTIERISSCARCIMSLMNSISISLRLQRVTTESAYVSVPLTADLLQLASEGSETQRINTGKLFQAAIALGRLESAV